MSNDLRKSYPTVNYDAHARTVATNAYWRQVKRTVNGKPVDEAQIAMIVDAIANGLSLQRDDVILDLACGNGALSAYLFEKCAGLIGVDLSPYLIDIAQRDFARPPNYVFRLDDARSYIMRPSHTERFTKCLIYGSFQYIDRTDAEPVLKALNRRFPTVVKVFVGNLPNRRLTDRFYGDRTPTDAELSDHEAQIGVWYHPGEFEALARSAGWLAKLSYMPSEFYGATYRFDATLERPES